MQANIFITSLHILSSSSADIVQIDPNAPPCPILDLDTPTPFKTSASGSYNGFFASKAAEQTKPKPAPASAPASTSQGMSIVDALRNGRPQLRQVNKDDTKKEGPSDAPFSSVFNKTLKPSRNQETQDDSSFEPVPLMINGKKLQTQSLPGQDSMSFSDMIKVASKVSLRKADVERSPGGTPINKRPVVKHDTIFSARLQEKFKTMRARESNLGAVDEQDKENWD